MVITLETIVQIISILVVLVGWYAIIKKVGADEMKTSQKIVQLESTVSTLTSRLNSVELCGIKNDKDIGQIKTDLDWIKKGIEEIKGMLGNKRIEVWNIPSASHTLKNILPTK